MLQRMIHSVSRGHWHIRNFGPQKLSLLQLKTIPLLMGPFQSDRGIGCKMVKITAWNRRNARGECGALGLGACDSWQVELIGRVVTTNFSAMRAAQVRKPTRQSRSMSDNNENKPAPTLGPDIMAAIGRELRLLYADIIAAGVPERFVEILRRLDDPSNEGETR
jgi:Anti-sigma factor NepR